jgi:hypothetical protein
MKKETVTIQYDYDVEDHATTIIAMYMSSGEEETYIRDHVKKEQYQKVLNRIKELSSYVFENVQDLLAL